MVWRVGVTQGAADTADGQTSKSGNRAEHQYANPAVSAFLSYPLIPQAGRANENGASGAPSAVVSGLIVAEASSLGGFGAGTFTGDEVL